MVDLYYNTIMLHQTIKSQINEALRAKDQTRLDTLRGLNALFQNELLTGREHGEFLSDATALLLIKRSVKQRKDSIAQFELGKRPDLAEKEQAELTILESFLPKGPTRAELTEIVKKRLNALRDEGKLDIGSGNPAQQAGKLTGILMKEIGRNTDGNEVRSVIQEVLADMNP